MRELSACPLPTYYITYYQCHYKKVGETSFKLYNFRFRVRKFKIAEGTFFSFTVFLLFFWLKKIVLDWPKLPLRSCEVKKISFDGFWIQLRQENIKKSTTAYLHFQEF